jgi:hypothetical protein
VEDRDLLADHPLALFVIDVRRAVGARPHFRPEERGGIHPCDDPPRVPFTDAICVPYVLATLAREIAAVHGKGRLPGPGQDQQPCLILPSHLVRTGDRVASEHLPAIRDVLDDDAGLGTPGEPRFYVSIDPGKQRA